MGAWHGHSGGRHGAKSTNTRPVRAPLNRSLALCRFSYSHWRTRLSTQQPNANLNRVALNLYNSYITLNALRLRMSNCLRRRRYFNRSLDPTVLSVTGSNISLPSEVDAAFTKLWTAVKSARAAVPPPPPPGPGHPPNPGGPVLPVADVLVAWNALPISLGVEALSARACSAGSQCVGVRTESRDCVCSNL